MELQLDEPLWLILLLPAALYFGWFGLKNFPASSKMAKTVFILRVIVMALLIFRLGGAIAVQSGKRRTSDFPVGPIGVS